MKAKKKEGSSYKYVNSEVDKSELQPLKRRLEGRGHEGTYSSLVKMVQAVVTFRVRCCMKKNADGEGVPDRYPVCGAEPVNPQFPSTHQAWATFIIHSTQVNEAPAYARNCSWHWRYNVE